MHHESAEITTQKMVFDRLVKSKTLPIGKLIMKTNYQKLI